MSWHKTRKVLRTCVTLDKPVFVVEHNGFQNKSSWEYSVPLFVDDRLHTNLILPQTSVDLLYRHRLEKNQT